MLNKGIVTEKDGENVKVSVFKDISCSDCNSCGEKNKISNVISILNSDNLEIGDEISFYIDDKKILFLGLLIYLFPILMFFLFYFIAAFFDLKEFFKILSSFIGLTLSFFIIYLYDKLKGDKVNKNIIIKNKIRKSY